MVNAPAAALIHPSEAENSSWPLPASGPGSNAGRHPADRSRSTRVLREDFAIRDRALHAGSGARFSDTAERSVGTEAAKSRLS